MNTRIILTAVLALLSLGSACFAQSSTAVQIENLQRQLDQLRLETQTNSPVNQETVTQSDQTYSQTGMTLANPYDNRLISPHELPVANSNPIPAATPAAKKYPDYKITGFFQLDSAYFAQSGNSIATLGDIQDGTTFRRVRLAAAGNVSEKTSYLMEFDMAQGQARFVDVWGQVADTPLGTMRIGRFRQPFGMSDLSSARELPFLERPTAFALSPFRQTGIMFSDTALSDRVTWAASGFRTISDNFGNVYGDDGGYGTAERLTWLAVDRGDDCGLLHLGFDYSFLDPARDQLQIASQDEVFVGQQPNLGPTGLSVQPLTAVPPFVNTGVFNVDQANLLNAEVAISFGSALIQSEYRWSNLHLPTGETATVHGGYATMRYVLTGETIPYNRDAGVFTRVKPDCPLSLREGGLGAWEVAARFSTIDLTPLFGLPGVPGPTRSMNSASLGLSWYWTANSKCQFNWINSTLNDPTLGDSVSNTFATRVQFDF